MEEEIDHIQREMDLATLKQIGEPYEKALKDDAQSLGNFYRYKHVDALFMPITLHRDTVFHIAAYRGSLEMLRVLLEMVPPSRKQDVLKVKNIHGNTILHEVAASKKVKAAEFLVRKLLLPDGSNVMHEQDIRQREEILADRNNLGETPLYRAAAFGSTKMVMYLAREIEEVATLNDHLKRTDGLSILHIAVIFQNFETATWLLKKDPNLATYKLEKDGKTCLHLLANMPTAFKSISQSHMNNFQKFIYNCIPSNLGDEDEDEFDWRVLEHGQSNKTLHKGFMTRMYHRFWRCLTRGWESLGKLRTMKETNIWAVELMVMLVKKDASWLAPHEAEEENLICLDREEEEVKEVPTSSAKRRCNAVADTPLLIAARTGIVEIVEEILKVYPQAIEHINQYGQNILHLAIMHRQFMIFDIVIEKEEKEEVRDKLLLGIDNDGFTVLHYAAVMKCHTEGTGTTVALKLQAELRLFKEVQRELPPYYTMHRNKNNLTAKVLFDKEHKEQNKAAQEYVKKTSESCSTVAILVAGVVFAAAFTAPGGYAENEGEPLLLNNPLYSFFTVMDVAGLASSLTSVVIFLSMLTSSFEMDAFLGTLPQRISLGFIFLFFSVMTTMLSFTAIIFLLIDLKKTWSTSLTYAAALLPICVYALFQFHISYEYTAAAIKYMTDFIKMFLPGNSKHRRLSIKIKRV